MSFINLIANLVQGSYTHVTIIPPMTFENTNSILTSPSSTIIPNAESSNSNTFIPPESNDTAQSALSPALPAQIHLVSNASRVEVTRPSREASVEQNRGEATLISTKHKPDSQRKQNLKKEFDRWLQIHFPQIEIR